ncbi:hypothetical protein [Xenorhabdus mauleonii]|uniref:hypothetical protein n=1 Tax=Xenorhabdus mauleonii TaxID=351675 RepID=UPI0014735C51|nr:hypothetical protein [Xenorhabdus mauleonii]
MRGSSLSPEARLWLFKFVPDEFVIPLPSRCNLKSIVHITKGHDFLREIISCQDVPKMLACRDKVGANPHFENKEFTQSIDSAKGSWCSKK